METHSSSCRHAVGGAIQALDCPDKHPREVVMKKILQAGLLAACFTGVGLAAEPPPPNPEYDAALARQLGADENGMRSYVLVVLKTGPTPVPKGEKRDAMFKGHFANIQRLA